MLGDERASNELLCSTVYYNDEIAHLLNRWCFLSPSFSECPMWIYILERTRHFTTEDLPMNRFFDSTNLERNWQTDCKLICFNSSSLDDDLRGFQWFKRRGFNLEDTTCIAIVPKCHPSYPRESSPKWPDIFLLSEIIDSISFFTVQVFEDPAKPSGTTFCHFSGSQKW